MTVGFMLDDLEDRLQADVASLNRRLTAEPRTRLKKQTLRIRLARQF